MSKNRGRFYFAEHFAPGVIPEGENIISLTPQASYLLGKYNVPYSIPESYYDERELRRYEDEYFAEQLEWIHNLDSILKNKIDFLQRYNINVVRGHYLAFKHLVDSIVIQSYILQQLLEKIGPHEIVYVRSDKKIENRLCIFEHANNEDLFFSDLLKLWSEKIGLNLSFITFASKASKPSLDQGLDKNSRGFTVIKRFLKTLYLFVKHKKYSVFWANSHKDLSEDISALFLHSGCATIDYAIGQLISGGHKVFVKENDDIFFESSFLREKVFGNAFNANKELSSEVIEQLASAFADLCTRGRLVEWVSEKCGIDVKDIIRPFMKYFFEVTCSRNIVECIRLIDFCKKQKIDFIIARAGTDKHSVAALLSSYCLRTVKTVCFQHGSSALDNKVWCITETGMFNIYFTSDSISQEYFRHEAKDADTRCAVYQEPYLFRKIRNSNRAKSDANRKSAFRKQVLYIPSFPGFCRVFNNMIYPPTWQYEFQKRLIDFFGEKKEYNFIYKHLFSQEIANESIISYIGDRGYKNVKVVGGGIADYLPKVGRVIIDYPSTPLFETSAFGLPVLAIVADYLNIWQTARDYFGKSIQTYATIPEALTIINSFLEGEPDDFHVDLACCKNSSALEILSKEKKLDKYVRNERNLVKVP